MKIRERQAIMAVLEATQNTPVACSASTDGMEHIGDIEIEEVVEPLERDVKGASIDSHPHVTSKRWWTVKFRVELKGSGTRGTATIPGFKAVDACIQACGYTSTVSAATSITYAPTSVPASANFFTLGKSVTLEVYLDGLKHIVAGAVGTLKKVGENGTYAYIDFEFKGIYAEPTDAAVPTLTITNVLPPVLDTCPITMHGLTAVWKNFEVDTANNVVDREDGGSANSNKGFVLTKRKPKGAVLVEAESVASHNFHNKLNANTQASTSIVVGATAGNIVTLTYAKSQYSGIKYNYDGDYIRIAAGLNLPRNTGDDWEAWVVT